MRSLFVAILAVVFCLSLTSTASAQKKNQKGSFVGTVVEIKKTEGKEEGTIKVKGSEATKKGKAKNAPTELVEKTFKITPETKFVKMVGKKAEAKEEPAKFSDLTQDAQVVVTGTDTAEQVKIQAKKKKKAAK